ncbi:hypothetical protein L1049_018518 [Liquidambar formosana]|uniref:HMA domain-containing protein n=1 Tax=Liquidambar formosana TaxID=63359 RepID=A0AAP0RA85_LIQFO
MAKEEKKEKEKVDEVITAVYRVNLHCQQCAREIQKPLMRTQGVHKVDVDTENSEIRVTGKVDPKKIHERIEKLSNKKVEMVLPKGKIKESIAVEEKEKDTKEVSIKDGIATEKTVKDTKEKPIVRTTSVKVNMHCDKCEQDLRRKLLKHKGVYSVKTDMKAQILTVEGNIESDKLISYIRKRVHKHAEIIPPKPEKKEEKKEKEEKEEKKEKDEKDEKKEKDEKEEKVKIEGEEKKEKVKIEVEETKEKVKDGVKSTESTNIIEFKEEMKVEVKDKEGKVPYFVHYVYAPQLFSDENPNACSVM